MQHSCLFPMVSCCQAVHTSNAIHHLWLAYSELTATCTSPLPLKIITQKTCNMPAKFIRGNLQAQSAHAAIQNAAHIITTCTITSGKCTYITLFPIYEIPSYLWTLGPRSLAPSSLSSIFVLRFLSLLHHTSTL